MHPGRHADQAPDRPAVIIAETGDQLTYRELADRSAQLANLLRQRGLGVGDRIAVLTRNEPCYFEAMWAALRLGLHLVPVNCHLTDAEAAYIITDSDAKALITSDSVGDLAVNVAPHAPACHTLLMKGRPHLGFEDYDAVIESQSLQIADDGPVGDIMPYTSGTTGRPKGVRRPVSTRPVAKGPVGVRAVGKLYGFDDKSVYLSPAPLYHAAPSSYTMVIQSLGGTVVVMQRFDASKALEAIDRYRVTHSQWVPTMFTRMLRLPEATRGAFDLTSHKVAIHSAAPCPVHVKDAMMQWWGPILHEYYGGSEAVGMTYASPEEWLAHRGTVGRSLAGSIHICDDDGSECRSGETGLVYFEDTSGFSYHGDDAKTTRAMHPQRPDWVSYGDIGSVDAEGFLYLTDRANSLIISGGVNIYPQEVEAVLLQHPAVEDVAVIGKSNEEFGEEVLAIVQRRSSELGQFDENGLEAELVEFARGHLAHYKCPRSVIFDDNLPRTETGKLLRAKLAQLYS